MEKFIAAYLLGAFVVGLTVATVTVNLYGWERLNNLRFRHAYETIGFINTIVAALLCVLVLID